MGWCPKAKFLILYETLTFPVRAQSYYTHQFMLEVISFILHGIIKNKLSLDQGGHPSWKSSKCPGIPFGSWKCPGSNKNWPLSWKSESFSHLCPGNLSNPVILIVKPVNSSS